MFRYRRHQSSFARALTTLELIFHSVVRSVRARHNNAFIAIGLNMLQVVMFVIVFYFMFTVLKMRSSAVRCSTRVRARWR